MEVGPGTRLGRFELKRSAGKGGMGSVWQARDTLTGKDVAIKILGLPGSDDVVRFVREAAMLATICHANVPGYVAHGEVDGVHYIAQEWVDGIPLATKLRNQGVTPREAIAIVIAVADALGAVHALGVIHRDVKPSNIILADRATLVDFGIARRANEAGTLTRTGALVGTPQYMSPEQARGDTRIEPAADVWALGCVLYELLAGRAPFLGEGPVAVRAKVLLAEPPPLRLVLPEASEALGQLVAEMLAKSAAKRPPTGADVAARLRAMPLLPELPPRSVESTASTAVMPVGPRRAPGSESCYVLITPLEDAPPANYNDRLVEVATLRGLDVHVLDDGSALLASQASGKDAAMSASLAAIDIRNEVWDAAITVFGQSYDDQLVDAIDRGSAILQRTQMESMFGEADGTIPIDDVIAALVKEELVVEQGPNGPQLRAATSG